MLSADSSGQNNPPSRLSLAARCVGYLDKNWLRVLLLVLIGVAVRSPALSGQLVWDDEYLARDNPFIKSPLLAFEAFRHYLFLDSFSAHYRPVQNLSFIVDYFLWSANPYGFHLTNVLLHVGSGVLLYFLLARLLLSATRPAEAHPGLECTGGGFDRSLVAWIIALLWTVHPVHSAAVDYISGRADSLAFLFACGAWLLVLAARDRTNTAKKALLYGSAASGVLLALCSREIACIWVALFLLHLLVFEKTISTRAKTLSLACCLAILATYGGLRQLPEQRTDPTPSSSWTAPMRAVLMLRSLGDYGRLMIFPSDLHMDRRVLDGDNYGSTLSWRNSVATEYLSISGAFVLLGAVTGCLYKGSGRRLRVFGAAWFLLAFLPISNLFELNATVAEHWLYLPSVGFLIFLAGFCVDLPARYGKGIITCACIAIVGLGSRSIIRSSDWVKAQTFYERTMAAGGSSLRVATNLGVIYSVQGEYAKAEQVFRVVLKMMPDYLLAKNNLADALLRQGRKEEAAAIYAASSEAAAESRQEEPRTWIAALNLARFRQNGGDDAAALAILEKARADYPGIWEIISLQAELVRRTSGPEAALRVVGNFARDNWWHYGASIAVGRLLAEKGDVEGADAVLRHASRLDVHDAEALNLIASMRVRQNQLQQAYDSQRRAVARQPDQPRQYLLLSDILERMGRSDEARAMVARVERMQAMAQAETVAN